MTGSDQIEELSTLFTFLADNDLLGYCPIYDRLARAIADDVEILRIVLDAAATTTRRGRIPVLFLASTHDVVLTRPDSELAAIYRGESDADPLPAFRAMLRDELDAVVANMRMHSVQTNEVGRSAPLRAALSRAMSTSTSDRPIALVEIGPSAGLNLFLDHFSIDYLRDGVVQAHTGAEDSTVQLRCELRGPIDPVITDLPPIVARTGIDASPIDASDPEQSRWLRACVWPGIPDRPRLLAAALDLVGQAPPPLVRGDAVDGLADLIASSDDDVLPIVISTWALAYIPTDGRLSILETLDSIGRRRDLVLITMEEHRFTPWLPEIDPELLETNAGDGTPTVLGVRIWNGGTCTTTPLALCHPHGRWMHWTDGDARG